MKIWVLRMTEWSASRWQFLSREAQFATLSTNWPWFPSLGNPAGLKFIRMTEFLQ